MLIVFPAPTNRKISPNNAENRPDSVRQPHEILPSIACKNDHRNNDVDVIDAQRIFEFYFGFETRLVINEPDSSKIPEEPDEPEKFHYPQNL